MMMKQVKPELFLDHYLGTIGLWRKPLARDGLSLFRAVSEQLFMTQAYHTNLYEACRLVFVHLGIDPNQEWNQYRVMEILSKMYRRDFLIYEEVGQPPKGVTFNNYEKKILLCRVDDTQLDSVYPAEFQENLAVCQSIVYEILYKEIFGLDSELKEAVNLLREQNKSKKLFCTQRLEDLSDGKRRDWSVCLKDRHIRKPTPPVPYRIAKALDPTIYRNVELDIWEEEKRELRRHSPEYRERFSTGDKCQVVLEGEYFHGHIQEIRDEDNSAVVFLEELGEKISVQVPCLKLPVNARSSRYHRRFQEHHSVSSSVTGKHYSRSSYSVQNRRYHPSLSEVNNNNFNLLPCYTHQFHPYTESVQNSEPSIMSTSGPEYMTIDQVQSVVNNNMVNNNTNANNNLNQMSVPSDVQRYIPPGVPAQSTVYNPYMYGSMNGQSNQPVACLCVPYLESIAVQNVNVNCNPSADTAGKDLPEINTLRFFYNLGVENYRNVSQACVPWSRQDMIPYIPPTDGLTAEPLNGNFCGQFSLPPPPLQSCVSHTTSKQAKSTTTLSCQNSTALSETVVSGVEIPVDVSKPDSDDQGHEEMADSNDSGCDSDSVSAHDESFKEVDNNMKNLCTSDVLEQKLDTFIAESDKETESSCIPITDQVQNASNKLKSKKKYYMYGNLKLVKPIKDIPPRFLTLLNNQSNERQRCEGEPIVIPFLPPRHNRHVNVVNQSGHTHVAMATKSNETSFNPEAKCFVPGQSSSIFHDPSIISCSPAQQSATCASSAGSDCKSFLPPAAYNALNYCHKGAQYISLPNPGTVAHSYSATPSPNHVITSPNFTGDGSKCSMPPSFSTGQQVSAQAFPGSVQCPVYYQTPYTGPGLGCMQPMTGAPGAAYQSQAYNLPSRAQALPVVQQAQ